MDDMSAAPTAARRLVRAALVLALGLLTAGLGSLAVAAPAAAADPVVVSLTADGPVPAEVALPAGGGVVRFVNDDTFTHRLTSPDFPDGGFDVAPGIGAEPGSVDVPVQRSGTVGYTDTRRRPVLGDQAFEGRVVVAPSPASPPPAGSQDSSGSTSTGSGTTGGGSTTSASGGSASSGSGTATPPGLIAVDPGSLAQPLSDQPVVPPAVAELLGDAPVVVSPQTASDRRPVQALQGPLPGGGTSRALGLPATLAALAAAGVVSLIVRVLLAEPAAARVARPLATVRFATAD